MTVRNFEVVETSVRSADTLTTLAEAMEDRVVPANRRVTAVADSRCPDEGLALLNGYIRIKDRKVRQAILDAVLAISGTDRAR